MNLESLRQIALNSSQVDLIEYLSSNIDSLRLLIFQVQVSQENTVLLDEIFDHLFYSGSFVPKELRESDVIQEFLKTLAQYAMRASELGTMSAIASHINHTGYKNRLLAFISTRNYNSIDDHILKLQDYLIHFNYAQGEDEDHLVDITNEIASYYNFAQEQLKEFNQEEQIELFKSKFLDADIVAQFPVLSIPRLVNVFLGVPTIHFDFRAADEIYEPSCAMQDVFNTEIINPIKGDSRTDWHHVLLGVHSGEVRSSVLEYGLTDFRVPYKKLLNENEKVLLYCYMNMRKHYFSNYRIFDATHELLEKVNELDLPICFIDYGCGPFTSILAYIDYCSKKIVDQPKFNYIGIDISDAMLNKGVELIRKTNMPPENKIKTGTNIYEIDALIGEENPQIYLHNASYLFASNSLDPVQFAKAIRSFTAKLGLHYFLFQNPNDSRKNIKYEKFKTVVSVKNLKYSSNDVVYYRNTRGSTNWEPKKEVVSYEVLEL